MQVSIYKKEFLNEIRSLVRPTTFTTIQSWLNRYCDRWLPDNGYPDADVAQAFDLAVLRAYRNELFQSGVCPRTLHAAFFPLRKFNDYLAKPDVAVLSAGIVRQVELPKKGYGTRLSISDDIVTKLFNAAELQYDPAKIAFSQAVLATLAYSGARAFELVKLTVTDINLTDGTLEIIDGKGGKSRLLYPGPEWLKYMITWLAFRDQKGCPATTRHLFVQGPKRGISDDYLRQHIKELASLAGMKELKHISPHGFRHGLAGRMSRNGATIRQIQAALGHGHAETTLKYIAAEQEDVKAMAHYGAMTPSVEAQQPAPAAEVRSIPSDRRRPATGAERSLRRNVRR